jgi:hypothetical protein
MWVPNIAKLEGGKMTDEKNPDNPRKLATACLIFGAGAVGRFSRPLTPAEGNRPQAMIGTVVMERSGDAERIAGRLQIVVAFFNGVGGVKFLTFRFADRWPPQHARGVNFCKEYWG